ncbi:MAG: hypothetical protein GY827_07325 [Cytophagales bacterium]|nr:hypothetical protein [Cytophagales bacterium]
MSKLKNVINKLTDNEYKTIYNFLNNNEAKKSAQLLELFRDQSLSDKDIQAVLEVNQNAFYTLRSRLNEKIQTFILQQTGGPRTELLQQVASIGEIILEKNRTISIATLRKLEKDLKHYDLSNELLIVYRYLKKLTFHNTSERFEYSQLYNKHLSYMTTVDKSEEFLMTYFSFFGEQILSYEKNKKLELNSIKDQLFKNTTLYKDSHRLKIYFYCADIFNKLFIQEALSKSDVDSIKCAFKDVKHIFEHYSQDTIYHNLQWVFTYLQILFNYKTQSMRLVDEALTELEPCANKLFSNYTSYTIPTYLLLIQAERYQALGKSNELDALNERIFQHTEIDDNNLAVFNCYNNYRAICYILNQKYHEAILYLDKSLESNTLKDYIKTIIDVKLLKIFCLIHTFKHEEAEFILGNVQRQIRTMGKENCMHSFIFMKMIKALTSEIEPEKKNKKIVIAAKKLENERFPFHSMLRFVKINPENYTL